MRVFIFIFICHAFAFSSFCLTLIVSAVLECFGDDSLSSVVERFGKAVNKGSFKLLFLLLLLPFVVFFILFHLFLIVVALQAQLLVSQLREK